MADKSNTPLGEDGAELRAQIDSLRREVSTIAGAVNEIAGSDAPRRAAATVKELGEQAQSALSDAEHYIGQSAGVVQDAIRERPVQSALLAFGIGIVVAKMFLGKRG